MIELKCVNSLKDHKYNCDHCIFASDGNQPITTNLVIWESIEKYIMGVANCKPDYLLTWQAKNLIRFIGR